MSLQTKNSSKKLMINIIEIVYLMKEIKIKSAQIAALAKYYDNIHLFNNTIVNELLKEFLGDSKSFFNNIDKKPINSRKAKSLSFNRTSRNNNKAKTCIFLFML